MTKKKENGQIEDVDPLTQAKNALSVYLHMQQSMKFFNDMLDYHIKHAKTSIASIEKKEEEALKKQTSIFNENQ